MAAGSSGTPQTKAFHAVVHGRVQGVGFRYWAQSTASRLALKGWVRNRDDGTVEVMCEGAPSALDDFARKLHAGPPGATVSRVDIRDVAPSGRFPRFSVVP